MFASLSIRTRLLSSFAGVLCLAVASLTPLLLNKVDQAITAASDIRLEQLFDSMNVQLAEQARLAEILCVMVAEMPTVQLAFVEGDRPALVSILGKSFDQLKRQYGLVQMQFHSPPAVSFLRLHKLDKYGDDLSDFRNTVVTANQRKIMVSGLESGVAGLGVRAVVPVYQQQRHIGSLEFGLDFGQTFFDRFKAKYAVDIAMYLADNQSFKAFAGTMEHPPLDERQLRAAFSGAKVQFRRTDQGKHLVVMAKPINDYSNQPIGVVIISCDEGHYVALLESARNTALLIALAVLALCILISMNITKSIVQPIDATAQSLTDIAKGQGDLRVRLPVQGNNELSRLSQAFNQFSDQIQHMVAQVRNSVVNLTAMAESLATNSSETRLAAQNQSSETEQVASALKQMTNSFQAVAQSAVNAATAAKDANAQAMSGNQVVQQSIQAITRLAGEVEQSAETIHGLEIRSKQIGGILETIGNIAEQTNLLALNAAIEAARAGEQGRGFAVVADEVRTLANRTQQATGEIQTMIEALQADARAAVRSMQSSQHQMQISLQQAEQAGTAFHSITQAIGTISSMNEQIASSSEQQTSVAETINSNEERISDASRQSVQAADSIAKSSETLAQLAEELQALLSKYQV